MTQFEKLFSCMKKSWVIAPYVALVILAYYYVDKPLATCFYQLDLRTHMQVLKLFTALGKWIAYVLLFLVAALYFRYLRVNAIYEARSWFLLSCVFFANLCCFVLKIILSRARPELLFLNNEFGFYWFQLSSNYWSFPSGHTITVVSLACGLGVLFPRYFYSVLLVALLVALTRIMLYYHYLSDVLSGFYISVLIVGFLTQLLKKNNWFKKMIIIQ